MMTGDNFKIEGLKMSAISCYMLEKVAENGK